MAYIIKRTDQWGGYLAQPGSDKSYTKNILKARRFDTLEQAQREACEGNERVMSLEIYTGDN